MHFPSPSKYSLTTNSDFVVRSARLKEVNYKDESDSNDDSSEPKDRFDRQQAAKTRRDASHQDEYKSDFSSKALEGAEYSCGQSMVSSALSGNKRKRFSHQIEQFKSQQVETTYFSKPSMEHSLALSPRKRLKQVDSLQPIKQEAEEADKRTVKTYILEEVSPDTTLLLEEIVVCRIDDHGIPHFSRELKPGSSYLIRRDWDKPAKNAHELPALQALEYPGQVIKALQDPRNPGLFMPGIRIKSVIMSPDTEHNYKALLKSQADASITLKESAIRERLQALVDRSASDKRNYDTHTVTLNGQKQYGLYAQDDIPTDIKEVGKQDWSYKGFFYDDSNKAKAEKILLQQYGPGFHEYVREIPNWKNPLTGEKRTCYIAALGSGGHMHNANTVLKKKEGLDGYLDYDLPKINLAFEDYTVIYELPNGQTLAYPHVEQAPMPGKKIKAGDELYINYGPGFLNMLRKKLANTGKAKEIYIKQEAISDDESSMLPASENPLPVWSNQWNPFASSDNGQLERVRSSSLSSIDSFDDSNSDDLLSLPESASADLLNSKAKLLKAQLPMLTKDWENVSHKKNALAAAQMRIEHPKWSQSKIVSELKQQGIKTSQNSLSRWGISPLPTPSQSLLEEAKMLKEKLPTLTPKWLNTVHREKANSAARIRLEHPDWNQPQIVAELKKNGFDITQQSLSRWGIQSKGLTDDTVEETTRLQQQLPYLTDFWVNARQRKEANAAAGLHLQHPDWTSTRIRAELETQGLQVTDQTVRSWGIVPTKLVARNDMDETAMLKEKMPHLKSYWVNSHRRKEANVAARLHLNHPDWTSSRISAELKTQGMEVSIPTLVGWGITARSTDSKLLEEIPTLKQQLPHLTSFWVNAHQREKANLAARMHLQHPDWLPTQIVRELKKQGVTIAPTTLLSWGISPRQASLNAMEN